MNDTQAKMPEEGTVIGTAKTKVDGRTVYVEILYGNKVVLPDGSQSKLDPVVYSKILEAYLAPKKRTEETSAEEPAPPEEDKEYFRSPEEFKASETQETDSESPLYTDRTSFFYRGTDNVEPSEANLIADDPEVETIPEEDKPNARSSLWLKAGLVLAVAILILIFILK